MAYTALETMRRQNRERFGRELGPRQPPLWQNPDRPNDLKSAALRFLHSRCQGLLFDAAIQAEEARTGQYRGTGMEPGQIPFNMERDLDRLCLEKALESFIDSGAAEDAYTVYYCYLQMFLGRYGRSRRMVELLSEYEANGSALLMEHRDHYSHSVYVFALGLAVYDTNAAFRQCFRRFYHLTGPEEQAAGFFLEYWGLTSLFHDIGYPFELPFEQVLSYFEVENLPRGEGRLYLSYRSVETLTALSQAERARWQALCGKDFADTTALFAFALAERLGTAYGISEEELRQVIGSKPVSPERFDYHMDHAFFSAVRLYRELAAALGPEKLGQAHLDALTAILLHNSLFKFAIAFCKDPRRQKAPLPPDRHPLAWLLMLCDELQCWDRIAYGRNSRTELSPMAADFDFSGGALRVVYGFDEEEREKIDAYRAAHAAWEAAGGGAAAPRLKAYSDMVGREPRFCASLRRIVDTGICPLTVCADIRPADRKSKHGTLSSSSFLHLYDFAVALHGRDEPQAVTTEELERKFEALSLEYQLSNINRAKSFRRYLDAIGCFFTDRNVDYPMVTAFTPEQTGVFAPLEHARWLREHRRMGWYGGDDYETLPLGPEAGEGEREQALRRALREQLRCHKLVLNGELSDERIRQHYLSLSPEDQGKDWEPFNRMLRLLRRFDGLRIYRL